MRKSLVLVCAIGAALSLPTSAEAAMYRCGKEYQDHPCEVDNPSEGKLKINKNAIIDGGTYKKERRRLDREELQLEQQKADRMHRQQQSAAADDKDFRDFRGTQRVSQGMTNAQVKSQIGDPDREDWTVTDPGCDSIKETWVYRGTENTLTRTVIFCGHKVVDIRHSR